MSRFIRASRALVSIALATACSGKNDTAAAAQQTGSTVSNSEPSAAATAKDPRVERADLARIKGSASAKVWVVIVSDFQCPYCKMWHDSTAPSVVKEYVETGKVRMAYINYPLRQHRHAIPTAEAAMCAGAQDKFWVFHNAIFETQARWTPMPDASQLLDSLGTALKLDMVAQRKCLSDDVMLPMIQADYERGVNAKVESTPSFVIGTEMLSGVEPPSSFRRVIDKALAASGSK